MKTINIFFGAFLLLTCGCANSGVRLCDFDLVENKEPSIMIAQELQCKIVRRLECDATSALRFAAANNGTGPVKRGRRIAIVKLTTLHVDKSRGNSQLVSLVDGCFQYSIYEMVARANDGAFVCVGVDNADFISSFHVHPAIGRKGQQHLDYLDADVLRAELKSITIPLKWWEPFFVDGTSWVAGVEVFIEDDFQKHLILFNQLNQNLGPEKRDTPISSKPPRQP